MVKQRKLAIWVAILAGGTTISALIGFWAYYSSDYYRRQVETGLAEFFGLPTDIEKIQPIGLSDRMLSNVQIWLPQRRARIFNSPMVIWDYTSKDAHDGALVQVHDAKLSIGSKEWESGDYMRVLRASLAHNFQQLNIRQVRFHNTRITWPSNNFELIIDGVEGNVIFDDNTNNGGGHAELTSRSLNGVTVDKPIRILAELDPENTEDLIPEVTLIVPPLPINILGLNQVLKSKITQGTFAGIITLRQTAKNDEIEAVGYVNNVRLEEFTQLIPGGAVPAVVDLKIEQVHIRDRQAIKIVFNGSVRELQVNQLLHRFGLPQIGGKIQLTINEGKIANNQIQRLSATGQWVGGSLEILTREFLNGISLPGKLLVRVNSLLIENNELVSGDIDLLVGLPEGQTGKIERDVLVNLAKEKLNLTLPEEMLPEIVEYVHMGAKIKIDGNKIRLLATKGPAGPALITAKAFGLNMPVLGNIDKTYDIEPLLQQAKERAKDKVKALKGILRN